MSSLACAEPSDGLDRLAKLASSRQMGEWPHRAPMRGRRFGNANRPDLRGLESSVPLRSAQGGQKAGKHRGQQLPGTASRRRSLRWKESARRGIPRRCSEPDEARVGWRESGAFEIEGSKMLFKVDV